MICPYFEPVWNEIVDESQLTFTIAVYRFIRLWDVVFTKPVNDVSVFLVKILLLFCVLVITISKLGSRFVIHFLYSHFFYNLLT